MSAADRFRAVINDYFRRKREAGRSSGDLFSGTACAAVEGVHRDFDRCDVART